MNVRSELVSPIYHLIPATRYEMNPLDMIPSSDI